MQPTQLLAVKRLSMTKTDSQTERPAALEPGNVPFLGWSRAALEFRVKAAALAPQGFRPLIIGDPGVGKRTMARAWRRGARRGKGE
jgi:DNA-binding NtrC family response regulator